MFSRTEAALRMCMEGGDRASRRDFETLRRLLDGNYRLTQQGRGDNKILRLECGGAASYAAPRAGRDGSCAGLVADHATFKLRERAKDVEYWDSG